MFAAVVATNTDHVIDTVACWKVGCDLVVLSRGDRGFGCLVSRSQTALQAESSQWISLGVLTGADHENVDLEPWERRGPIAAVGHALFAKGPVTLSRCEGPFAIIHWNVSDRELLAARDALGISQLYYCFEDNCLRLANSLDAFADKPFDIRYIAEFIVGRGNPQTVRTIRAGVFAVQPGSWLRWKDGHLSTGEFWSALNVASRTMTLTDAADEFRARVQDAVRKNVEPSGRTWAHLSGGLDSSSVVSVAAAMSESDSGVPHLGGTVMLTDSLGNADETEFANEVARRYGVPMVTLAGHWPWQSDGNGPPVTDRPTRDYPYYCRDRAMAAAIADRGGTSVLSGIGPDVYLPYTTAHCPDLVWRAQLAAAFRELHGAAVASRRSLWRTACSDGIGPLLSRRSKIARASRLSSRGWFAHDFAICHADQLLSSLGRYSGPRGTFYQQQVAAGLDSMAEWLPDWLYSPGVTVRHPLMWRPVVEFSLSLPYDLRTDVYWTKPLIRTGLKHILPDKVRLRLGKSIIAPRTYWAFRHERPRLERLLTNPVLADLGCIEPATVKASLGSFSVYQNADASFLYALLSLETWLSAKSGRWSTTQAPFERQENPYEHSHHDRRYEQSHEVVHEADGNRQRQGGAVDEWLAQRNS
jgi:asparagine synthase (glutamine-hydrolysing)